MNGGPDPNKLPATVSQGELATLADSAAKQAIELIQQSLQAIADQHKAVLEPRKATDDPPRLFFPSGIELIKIQFDIGTTVKIGFTVAGKDAKYGAVTALQLDQDDFHPG
jgi:hypothetical protein